MIKIKKKNKFLENSEIKKKKKNFAEKINILKPKKKLKN